MADDWFTAEVEWLLRLRRENTKMHRIALAARRYLLDTASTQGERDIRQWQNPRAQKLYDELDYLVNLLGDPRLYRNDKHKF